MAKNMESERGRIILSLLGGFRFGVGILATSGQAFVVEHLEKQVGIRANGLTVAWAAETPKPLNPEP